MSSGSSSPSSASSRLDVSTELGGPRVEVSAVRTGSQQDQQAEGSSTSDSQTPGVRTSISQARIDYGVGWPISGAWIAPNSIYTPCAPYNVCIPCSPCTFTTTCCHKAPRVSSAPQGPATPVHLDSAVDKKASTAQALDQPSEEDSKETRIITKNGFEVVEQYVNGRLVNRTVKRILPSSN